MISVNAYAKVNLSLEIIGKREDGYHIIDTVMQTISLFDVVDIKKASNGDITIICDEDGLSGESNLCYKAARLFFDKTKIDGGCCVNIKKNIPVSAGLGGGSADAAATLKGLNLLYGQPLDLFELKKLALSLGADVPFFIEGGTARARGIGEQLKKIENNLHLYFLLIKEGEKPSTAFMYKEIDELGVLPLSEKISDDCEKSLASGDIRLFENSLKNHFTLVWDYEKIKQDIIAVGARQVSLSGSGPTVIGIFKNKNDTKKAFEILSKKYDCIYYAESINE